MISITGSTRAGIAVAQAAAPTVKRVAQELGGKSPNVILPDADLDRAVSRGIAAAFRNLGQSCSAPTRMIVPRPLLTEIEEIAKGAAAQIVVGNPLCEASTHGAIANRAQFDRIQTMIGVGISEGAKLLTGGRPGGPFASATKRSTALPTRLVALWRAVHPLHQRSGPTVVWMIGQSDCPVMQSNCNFGKMP